MKYDPIMCMMVPDSVKTKDSNTLDKAIKSCDANWAEAYKEMENVMNKYFMQGQSVVYNRVKELYMKHKGDPAWETAWQKFNQ